VKLIGEIRERLGVLTDKIGNEIELKCKRDSNQKAVAQIRSILNGIEDDFLYFKKKGLE
jgi:hypothetical protein